MADLNSSPRLSYDPQILLNAQPVMVAVIDPVTYTVQFQNETGLQKLGDISGLKCHEAIAGCPAPCAFCKMPEAVSNGRVTVSEVALPNSQHLLVQWSKAVTNDGRMHVIETITDVTEHKRVEATARRAEKMEALSRLAGGMAHDINNLLTVITGASEKVSREMEDYGSSRAPIRQIQSAVDRASALTRQLVAFSHHQIAQPSVIDLNAMVLELEPRVRTLVGDGITLEMALHEDAVPVLADRQQIDQIVTVLVSNAREAMSGKGRLTISTTLDTIANEEAKEQDVKPGRYVRFAIRDTGCGVDPEMQAHLFEPFFIRTGEETGRGLGLSSVYGIVRQSGGFIEVASERHVGTLFSLAFPRSEQQHPVPAHAVHVAVSVGHPTILLVEDDEDVRLAVSDMLKGAGYHLQEACDGMDALQRLRSMASPPHLVLTDVMMPRMTGPQLAAQLQTIMPQTQVLYMSGYSDQLLEPGAGQPLAFIHKPFSARELIRKVRELLAE